MLKNAGDIALDRPRLSRRDNEQCVIAYTDLRTWLAEAERLGEVTEVSGANTESDIGLASELVMRSDESPCVVFDNIPGYPEGHRVLVNFFGGKRKNMTLGFPSDLSRVELSDAYYRHKLADIRLLPFDVVSEGPILQNVMTGDNIDVGCFPVPHWHAADGGRYIGTGCFSVTTDPDTGQLNLGTYRVMVHDRTTVGVYISPGKHGRVHRDKWQALGKPMPMVIVCGGDPLTFLAACTEMPAGKCEYDIVGALRGVPVRVIKGEQTGLPFPADAEIVLEGFVDPVERRLEGPFGDWTGYYDSGAHPEPVMHVKAVYHRDSPILLGCPPQRPPDEMCRYRSITRSAMLRESIEKAGVPDVTMAWAHEVGNARMLVGVAIRQRYAGHAKQAGHIAAMCHVGAYAGKYVVVVDEDVDVSNLEELIWAMITRSDPKTSIDIIAGAWSTPLDPRIPPWEKLAGNTTNSRAIIDACRPFHWKDQFPMVNAPSAEEAARARQKFGWILEGKRHPE